VPEPALVLSPVEAVDERKLEALAKAAEPLPSVAAVPAKAVSEEELRQADEKLASLLKKPGGGIPLEVELRLCSPECCFPHPDPLPWEREQFSTAWERSLAGDDVRRSQESSLSQGRGLG